MKIAKLSKSDDPKSQTHALNNDVEKLYQLVQGRIRFGGGGDGDRGENISGYFQSFTSHATPDTEFAVAHELGAVPVGRLIFHQDKAGTLYQGPSTGTAWTATNAYFKCNVASVTFLVFFLK